MANYDTNKKKKHLQKEHLGSLNVTSFQRWSSSKATATAVSMWLRQKETKLSEALIWSLLFGIYSKNNAPKLQVYLVHVNLTYGFKRPWVFPRRMQGYITQPELDSIDFLPTGGS